MQRPVQITFHQVDRSESLETLIREKASKLEAFHPHIIGLSVAVEMPHKRSNQGNSFDARVDAQLPGGQVVIGRDSNADVRIALRDAFEAARRQLEERGRKERSDARHQDRPWEGAGAASGEER